MAARRPLPVRADGSVALVGEARARIRLPNRHAAHCLDDARGPRDVRDVSSLPPPAPHCREARGACRKRGAC